MLNNPIIKIELDNMKLTLHTMISQRTELFNDMIKKSLDNFCNEDHLESLIDEKVRSGVKSAMSESIDSYFRYGDGKKAVDEIVQERLKAEIQKIMKE